MGQRELIRPLRLRWRADSKTTNTHIAELEPKIISVPDSCGLKKQKSRRFVFGPRVVRHVVSKASLLAEVFATTPQALQVNQRMRLTSR